MSHPPLLEAPEIGEDTLNTTPTKSYLKAFEINRAFLQANGGEGGGGRRGWQL